MISASPGRDGRIRGATYVYGLDGPLGALSSFTDGDDRYPWDMGRLQPGVRFDILDGRGRTVPYCGIGTPAVSGPAVPRRQDGGAVRMDAVRARLYGRGRLQVVGESLSFIWDKGKRRDM